MIGVWLQVLVGDTPVQIRGEVRPAIIAFLLATVWEFAHIEWMATLHQATFVVEHIDSTVSDVNEGPILAALQLQNAYKSYETGRLCRNVAYTTRSVWTLWIFTMVLFFAGSPVDLLLFQTTEGEQQQEVVCERSYNLYSLGTELISDRALRNNSAKAGIWTLCIAYLLLGVALPLFVHLIQLLTLLGFLENNVTVLKISDSLWTFASVEVLLMGVYIVQVRMVEPIQVNSQQQLAYTWN